ncbi:Iterative polyketide synthase CazM 11 [Phlyctema vagabunda]|uniref:Iterative polyketide synthase CazM 11 n=1 Tax=Phlyctema vagabunda TaxID=108571 RepID=A0ABR4PTI1_9HELO
MVTNTIIPSKGSTVLLFGPQALSFDEAAFHHLRDVVVNTPEHNWILEAISSLPQALEKIISHFPEIKNQHSLYLLQDLYKWFESGNISQDATKLPNILLSPLVVLAQLTQYSSYLQLANPESTEAEDLYQKINASAETIGFCTGILSAFAVSSSNNKANFTKYGAVALRLAMLIGIVVDAQESSTKSGASGSFSAMWNSPEGQEGLLSVLKSFPEAYISVNYDENRATITTTAASSSKIQEQLKTVGNVTAEVNLHGRFHSQCYQDIIQDLIAFSDKHEEFQFPDATELVIPTRSNAGGEFVSDVKLHHEALRSILIAPPQWFKTFSTIRTSSLSDKSATVVTFGPERCVPPSLVKGLTSQVVHFADVKVKAVPEPERTYSDNDIAVVGMSCKVPGADGLEEFWDLLCEGKSQHQEVPKERFGFETVFRDVDPKRKWFGNFLEDYDKFDHKFFKKSPREIASTDPQQRLILQIAYQAVEQSGYFQSKKPDTRVGCYVGVCACDYDNNIACHAPNAFSATGNLKGFIAGKVSHYFGWTGPGLTIDTACSSSAVAVHQACRAILSGECTAALAGGTHVMTSPLWFQNLAGASFLSLTGQCKPFDAKADGYCRGEGVAAVFLKKMSAAIADGDQILGSIAATGVQQNQNCTPIFVPNAPSLSDLFRVVTKQAGLTPSQIGVVEAHGTGTSVGDPAEYESIRRVLGGPNRPAPLVLSSVKGLVGHIECTSGIVSLIKVLLMIHHGMVPPQASFSKISPGIKSSPADQMEIPTSLQPWKDSYRAALINNYGASGSNASMVVTQAPSVAVSTKKLPASSKQIFWLPGLDDRALKAYTSTFRKFLHDKRNVGKDFSISNLAFNISRQSNRLLDRALLLSATSVEDLEQKLVSFELGKPEVASVALPKARPVVLCFGGQISTFVGLDRQIYDNLNVFRKHLDHCDTVCHSIGVSSIFPGIFDRTAIPDPVKLQTMLFAMQYSCAKTWIESGVEPVTVVGHSFGELTALCIAGTLSLDHALKMIVGRATVIRDSWGSDRGAMMVVEADLSAVKTLLELANKTNETKDCATIACYNGPRSFTLAGSTASIDAVAETVTSTPTFFSMRTKRLNVSNAFHSALVESITSELEESAKYIVFKEPFIPVERATELASDDKLTSKFVANHMRDAVYFDHAIQRIAKKYPSAIFLEAGSNSTVTSVASRALGSPVSSHFQAVNITSDNSLDNLSDATLNLWKAGLNVNFWGHSSSQTTEYSPLLLPAYQFDKIRHWMELKAPPKLIAAAPTPQIETPAETIPTTLLTFVGFQDSSDRRARFRINTMIPQYHQIMEAHLIAQTAAICPATVQFELAIEALKSIHPEVVSSGFAPQIHGVDNQSPLCSDATRCVWLDLETLPSHAKAWSFKITSTGTQRGSVETTHTTGELICYAVDDPKIKFEFARYERLVKHQRCLDILNSSDADDIIQGRNIYKTFSEIVDYGPEFRGLTKLVGKGKESAGHVVMKYNSDTWLDAHLSDSFCQVGGIWVNCMTDRAPSDMFIANGIEQWMRSPELLQHENRPAVWDVFAYHHRPSEKAFLTDVFIFDPTTGALLEMILGISYVKVSKASMSKVLFRLTVGDAQTSGKKAAPSSASKVPAFIPAAAPQQTFKIAKAPKAIKAPKPKKEKSQSSRPDITPQIMSILCELSGLDLNEIKPDDNLANIGIDSLMGMEMAKELEGAFKISLSDEQLMAVTDIPSLMQCINSALGPVTDIVKEEEEEEDSESESEDESSSAVSEPDTVISSVDDADILEFLIDFLGVDKSDLTPSTFLRDLGVDSLLSTELRADLSSKFGCEIDEHIAIEELTVDELSQKVNGPTKPVKTPKVKVPKSKSSVLTPATSTGTLSPATGGNLVLPASTVIEAFAETKALTDKFIENYKCTDYVDTIMPAQTEMCIVLTLEAFEELGCPIRSATVGQKFPRVKYLPEHKLLVDYLYLMVEKESRVIEIVGDEIVRTSVPAPVKSSEAILQDLLAEFPDHSTANKLTHYAGANLGQVLSGKTDGIKLIFGSEKGRELVGGLYGDWPVNKLFYKQMEDFLTRLVSKLPMQDGPLKILEMGAGTGGTTKWLVPLLSSLNVPVEYTFTDLAPSFVAAARKRFKPYPFMKFKTHDIEQVPVDELLGTQHIIVASNAVHATHSLEVSTANIRKALRPDGFLMMLEMTGTLYWVDMIFGLFEGWWLFDDGRVHAVTHESRWKKDLQAVGYGHVDWTDGERAENKIEKLIIALASGTRYENTTAPLKPIVLSTDCEARQVAVNAYVKKYTEGFVATAKSSPISTGQSVLITGATGSLGCYLVAHFSKLPEIKSIICLNRRSNKDPKQRQLESLTSKGINLSQAGLAKLTVFESDMTKPLLGLPVNDYTKLLKTVDHVVHNAWLMNAKLPLKGFESQFKIMRNLIDFANGASSYLGTKFSFQFISSIATVGHYPVWTGQKSVPEERMTIESILPNGYGDAKYICELMLDDTLHKFPQQFRTMSVRLGQVAGSTTSGYWNPIEHLSFLWKSSQTLNALPRFDGLLSWTPVDLVAGTLSDIVLANNTPFPIYHIDNPVRQPWSEMMPVLADALDIPQSNLIPYTDWVQRVRDHPSCVGDVDNPAIKLIDFLDDNFIRMSCGGLLLDTEKSRMHSKTLSNVGPVSGDIARKFVQSWKDMGFLS